MVPTLETSTSPFVARQEMISGFMKFSLVDNSKKMGWIAPSQPPESLAVTSAAKGPCPSPSTKCCSVKWLCLKILDPMPSLHKNH